MTGRMQFKQGAPVEEIISSGSMTFAMVEKEALKNLDELMVQDMQAARLAVMLIRLMEAGSAGVVVISRASIQEMLNISQSTAARAIRALVKGKWVHRVRISGAYAFAINESIAWVGSRKNKTHAVFSATVVASRSEQDQHSLSSPELKKLPIAFDDEAIIPVGKEPAPPSQKIIEGAEPVARQQLTPQELEARGQQRLLED